MDHALVDRRHERRVSAADLALTATVRPGGPVHVVDVSSHGVQIESEHPLRPGSRVHVRLVLGDRTLTLAGVVSWCAVCALDPERGLVYRGAMRFDERCLRGAAEQ